MFANGFVHENGKVSAAKYVRFIEISIHIANVLINFIQTNVTFNLDFNHDETRKLKTVYGSQTTQHKKTDGQFFDYVRGLFIYVKDD